VIPVGFVDVHAHVVPSGDDGATSVTDGLELCRLAFDAGTRVLFATPHAHAPWDSYPLTPERRHTYEEAFPVMRDTVADWGLDLRRGWEVFPTVLTADADADADPVDYRLGGTRAVLVEFPGGWLDYPDPIPMMTDAGERLEAAGLVPVLAHPERCTAVTDDPSIVIPLAARGWLLCLNSTSLLGRHGAMPERTAWRLIDDGVVSLVASDAHRHGRPPVLDEAYRAVESRCGQAVALPLFDGSSLPWSG
jgi:protein-tyrosine phosphatase